MLVHRYFTSQLHYSVYLEIRRSCNLHASAQSPRQCQGAISPSSASSRHFLFHLQEREQQQQLVPSNGHHKVVFIYYFVAHSLNKVSTEQHEVKFSVINWIPLRFHLTYWPFGKEDVLQRACTYYIHIKGVLFNIKQINFAIIELRFNKCVPLNRIHLAGITQSQITTAPSYVPRFSQPLYLWSCLRIYPCPHKSRFYFGLVAHLLTRNLFEFPPRSIEHRWLACRLLVDDGGSHTAHQ